MYLQQSKNDNFRNLQQPPLSASKASLSLSMGDMFMARMRYGVLFYRPSRAPSSWKITAASFDAAGVSLQLERHKWMRSKP